MSANARMVLNALKPGIVNLILKVCILKIFAKNAHKIINFYPTDLLKKQKPTHFKPIQICPGLDLDQFGCFACWPTPAFC